MCGADPRAWPQDNALSLERAGGIACGVTGFASWTCPGRRGHVLDVGLTAGPGGAGLSSRLRTLATKPKSRPRVRRERCRWMLLSSRPQMRSVGRFCGARAITGNGECHARRRGRRRRDETRRIMEWRSGKIPTTSVRRIPRLRCPYRDLLGLRAMHWR